LIKKKKKEEEEEMEMYIIESQITSATYIDQI
jgi:hypothetical protein